MKSSDIKKNSRLIITQACVVLLVGCFELRCEDQRKQIITLDVCPTSRAHFRNDWSLVFPLKQGRLMLVWCEYYATSPQQVLKERTGNYSDPAACRISARISTDKGRHWSETFTLQDNTARLNVKHPNLVRLSSDPKRILLFFTSRRVDGGVGGDIRIFMKESRNEGESWSQPVQISSLGGTHFLMADRVLQLPGGRILLPTFQSARWLPFDAFCYLSDDDGKTWRVSKKKMKLPGHGAQEPSIVRLQSGKLLAVLRTSLGAVYKSYSLDEGDNWSKPVSTGLAAPASTPLVKRLPGSKDLLLVWNNIYDPKHADFQNGFGPRNPLTSAISSDEGKTWSNIKTIEDRNPGASSTPAITFVGNEALLTYNTQPYALSKRELYSVRLKIIPIGWFRSK
jgi:sialidase-1